MALQMPQTNVSTGTPYPVAYGRIDDALASLKDNNTLVTLNWYRDAAAAAAGLLPVVPADMLVLDETERAVLRTGAVALLYQILKNRPAYASALSV